MFQCAVHPPPRLPVLLVGDDPVVRVWLAHSLTGTVYRVEVPRGRDVLQMIRDRRPALVLLDCDDEEALLDGLNVLTVLQLDRRTRAIPAIICTRDRTFTAHDEQRFRWLGYRLLRKPCD